MPPQNPNEKVKALMLRKVANGYVVGVGQYELDLYSNNDKEYVFATLPEALAHMEAHFSKITISVNGVGQ